MTQTAQSLFRQLANIITLSRILGVVVLFWMTPYTTNFWLILTIIVYTIICITDFLDGWVARRFHLVSDLGKILDPLADKILVLVFLPLLEMQAITSFPVFIILAREYAIMAVRVFSAKSGTIIPASFSGKLKTAITLPVCGILFARISVTPDPNLPLFLLPFEHLRAFVYMWPNWVFNLLIWSTVFVTIWSFTDYCGSFIWQFYVNKFGGNEQKAKQAIRSFIPNVLSMTNLICGLLAAFFAIYHVFELAVGLILIGMILDAIDGPVARRLKADTSLGQALDTRADFVTFGVAPGILVASLLIQKGMLHSPWSGILVGLLYYVSVHFRLWRFSKTGHQPYFEGMPSPVGAALVSVASISVFLNQIPIFLIIVGASALLMASTIPFIHNHESKKTYLKYFRFPTMLFLFLTFLDLLAFKDIQLKYVTEALFVLTLVYVASPLFIRLKPKQ